MIRVILHAFPATPESSPAFTDPSAASSSPWPAAGSDQTLTHTLTAAESQAPTPHVRSRSQRPRVATPAGSSDEFESQAHISRPVHITSGNSNQPPLLTPSSARRPHTPTAVSSGQASGTLPGQSQSQFTRTPSASGRPKAPTPQGTLQPPSHARHPARTPTQQNSSPSYVSIGETVVENRNLRKTPAGKSSHRPRPARRSATNPPIELYNTDSSVPASRRSSYGATDSAQDPAAEPPPPHAAAQPPPRPYEPWVPMLQKGNKRFSLNMKRFILSTLGMPNVPGISPGTRTKCCESSFR